MKKWIALLISLSMLCAMGMAWAEENAAPGKKTVTIGRAAFQVDADSEITNSNDVMLFIGNDRYQAEILYLDWENEEIKNGDMDLQTSNFFLMAYLVNNDQEMAYQLTALTQPADIGMPDGESVIYAQLDSFIMLTYYFPNMGIMIGIEGLAPEMTGDQLFYVCQELILSFRPDGMSAYEMSDYARQYYADLAARKYVVITNSSANIRSGPDVSAAKIKTGLKGERFRLLGEENNWYKIDVDGKTGYVSKGLAAVE